MNESLIKIAHHHKLDWELAAFLKLCKDSGNNIECFKHTIQLQLSDANGFPVDGTQFWVTLDIIKQSNLVTIQFPVINFQTGPKSAEDPGTPLPGGYIYTSGGFLPPDICPNDLVYRSIVGASNDGASLPFSFAQLPSTLPVPPVGYILSITNAGAITIQCAGTFGNIIPPGPQILMPCSITYIIKPKVTLCNNSIIDPGFTNITQFSNPFAINDALRDSHVCDIYDGVVAFAWVGNGNISDKTQPILNVFVSVGQVNSDGTLNMGAPVQLTNFPSNVIAASTAVTINRADKNNIIVSYGIIDFATPDFPAPAARAVSFDGGKTWPAPYNYVAFNGSISGTTLTVTDVFFGPIEVGQTIYAYYSSPGIVPGNNDYRLGNRNGWCGYLYR